MDSSSQLFEFWESVQLHSCEAVAGCPKTNRLLLALCQTALSRLSIKTAYPVAFES